MSRSPDRRAARHRDVAIVGAGPAGLAAAASLQGHGLDVVIIDEQPRPGGQILRQPPAGFSVANWLVPRLYDRVKALLYSMEGSADVSWQLGSTVLGILNASPWRRNPRDGHELWLQDEKGSEVLHCRVILLAPGCYEQPLPFPGWTLPGVMGAGAIQAFVKSQQLVPGEHFVLAGHHPLQLIVADQLLSAGGKVGAVVFTQAPRRALRILRHPFVMSQHRRQLAQTGRILVRLKRAGVPVVFGSSIVRAHGTSCVEGAEIAPLERDGTIDRARAWTIACDRIGTCHGFLVSAELARQAGAAVTWREDAGGWTVVHDRWFESSVQNLFVAGEITGMAGADAAMEEGRLAALGILRALDRAEAGQSERLAAASRRRLGRLNTFAATLNRLSAPPPRLFEDVITSDTLLCRCESISFGEVRRQIGENPHVATADAAKLLTRAGMGLCQGRFCGYSLAATIARERGRTAGDVGALRAQVPVKPVMLQTLRRNANE